MEEIYIRIMEKKDLFDVPDAWNEFEKHGNDANYFFFVIENEDKKVIGYLIAEKEKYKAVIKKLQLPSTLEDKGFYQNMVMSKLFNYIKKIKNCEGKRIFFQVSRMDGFKKPV